MKLKDQVVSLELAKRLKELGVKQKSYFAWGSFFNLSSTTPTARFSELLPPNELIEIKERSYIQHLETFAAFTVAELGELLGLPHSWGSAVSFCCCDGKFELFDNCEEHCGDYVDENEANARAKMLIHLTEKKLISPKGGDEAHRLLNGGKS